MASANTKKKPVQKATGKGQKAKKVSDKYTIQPNSMAKLKRDVRLYQEQRRRMIRELRQQYPDATERELEDKGIIPPKRNLSDFTKGRKVFVEDPNGREYTIDGEIVRGRYEYRGGIKSKKDLQAAYKALERPLKKNYMKKRQRNMMDAILEAMMRSTAASDEELKAIEKALKGMSAAEIAGWRLNHPDLVKEIFEWYNLHRDMVTDDADTVKLRMRILRSLGIEYGVAVDPIRGKYIRPGSVKVGSKQATLDAIRQKV